MIAFNDLEIKQKNYNDGSILDLYFIEHLNKQIDLIKNDINNLKDFSTLLTIVNIRKIDNFDDNSNLLYSLKIYENTIISNDYNFCRCPKCKNKECLKFHKFYERNIIFNIFGYEIEAIIKIAVLECTHCKGNKERTQHYHALLPVYIFPYHCYSSTIIFDTLNDRLIEKLKISIILERKNISHQLFYKWLNGFYKYSLSSSIIVGVNNSQVDLIKEINKDSVDFLFQFYKKYYHPFFLFRLTCVPLAIMP